MFHSPTGSLSVKKILELPLGGDDLPIAYPAVRFHLYRVYIQNNGQPSAQELVRTATWSSEEVEAAYRQRGDSTTVETVLSFTDLEQYAPNGSLYLYHVEEDKSFLGGYDTWCGPGDLEAQDVTGGGYTVGGLLPHEEREEADATFLNSRKAVQTEFITLTGQKAWEDFHDAFGLRPDAPYEEGKDGTLVPVIRLTVTRRAAAQEGQGDPHIEEKLTEGGDYTVKWTQDAETGKWTYQIWGADDPDAEEPGISAEEPAEPGSGQERRQRRPQKCPRRRKTSPPILPRTRRIRRIRSLPQMGRKMSRIRRPRRKTGTVSLSHRRKPSVPPACKAIQRMGNMAAPAAVRPHRQIPRKIRTRSETPIPRFPPKRRLPPRSPRRSWKSGPPTAPGGCTP
ncbi:Cna B-type domain-containing protein [Oscillibacter sp.]|uniref:Cna B-type domain-containing protein n=1 Tax=Oscillibacter sp. TaxID=1945593 RepID=UPI00257E049C|nr:Cna B-type domain-containing protein [Oscillibacter sp.]